MLSAAMTMAAAQASKKAFIVFHLAGLVEFESIQNLDASGNSLARRYAPILGRSPDSCPLARNRCVGRADERPLVGDERTSHPSCRV